jgi:predicted ATPase
LLVREAHADRIELAPLAEAALRDLVRSRYALPAADEARLVGYLAGRTGGNALFVTELLRTLEERGVVTAAGTALGDLADVAVPTLLREVVAGRVARLGREVDRLLEIAAVIGQEIPLAVWATVGEVDDTEVEEIAEQALGARLHEQPRDAGRVAFTHALIREALYAGIPAIRRRRMHVRAAEALAAEGDAAPDAVAYHFRAAGDARATEWQVQAGWRAYRSFAYQTARARFDAALSATTGTERARILIALAALDRFREAGYLYAAEAVAAAQVAGDEILAAVAGLRLGVNLAHQGRVGEALTASEAALRTLDAAPDEALPDFFGLPGLAYPRPSSPTVAAGGRRSRCSVGRRGR